MKREGAKQFLGSLKLFQKPKRWRFVVLEKLSDRAGLASLKPEGVFCRASKTDITAITASSSSLELSEAIDWERSWRISNDVATTGSVFRR